MKANKKLSQKVQLAAVFVAGLALATFGWWQSDRLDLAYGSSAEINMVADGWRQAPTRCNPAGKPSVTRHYNGCEVVASTQTCLPHKEYVVARKTKSGYGSVIHQQPVKRAQERISYQPTIEERVTSIQTEIEQTDQEIANYKKVRKVAELVTDTDYQDKVKRAQEMKQMVRANPTCMQVR